MQPSPLPSSKAFSPPQMEALHPFNSSPPSPSTLSPGSHSVDLPVLDTSYKWTHTICGLLWLASFTQHHVFETHPHRSMDQNLIPFFFFNVILFIFLYSRFLLVINFIHISVYMSVPIAQFSTPPSPPPRRFPPLVSIRLFSTSVSQLLPCKPVHLYHFSKNLIPFYGQMIFHHMNILHFVTIY